MPRASVSVRTVRSRRRGKKWSPVLVELAPDKHNMPATSQVFQSTVICQNSSNTSTAPTATVIKIGNVKISFECEAGANQYTAVSGTMFIMFVPQGLTPTVDYPSAHPEYIMAWRAFNPCGQTSATSIQTRLKRNLNSGDAVVMFYKIRNDSANAIELAIRATVTYVCCAN